MPGRCATGLELVEPPLQNAAHQGFVPFAIQFGKHFCFTAGQFVTINFAIDELHGIGDHRDLLRHGLDGGDQLIVFMAAIPEARVVEKSPGELVESIGMARWELQPESEFAAP